MSHEEIMDLTDAEREAERFLQTHYGIDELEITGAELIDVAGMPVYKITGIATKTIRRGFFGGLEEIVYDFTLKIHASDGKIVGKRVLERAKQ